jgi:hypothetical protein
MASTSLANLSIEDKKVLSEFLDAWVKLRNDTGFGEVKVTMQKKKIRHIFYTPSKLVEEV